MDFSLVETHFPEIELPKLRRLQAYGEALLDWNTRVNLISRKDSENFVEHHLLHALAISRFIHFPPGSRILDVGTGGGLPGIPLAILHPNAQFTLVDSLEKKINALKGMTLQLTLKNVLLRRTRIEEVKKEYDWVLGRAVTSLPVFVDWIRKRVRQSYEEDVQHGLIYLKGSLYHEECKTMGVEPDQVHEIYDWIPIDYYKEKYVLFFERETVLKAKKPFVPKPKGKKRAPKKKTPKS